MTNGELKKMLNKYPDNLEIILQKDTEGNSFSPLDSEWQGTYVPDSTWHGEAYLDSLDKDNMEQGFGPEDVRDPNHGDNKAALFLVPVN